MSLLVYNYKLFFIVVAVFLIVRFGRNRIHRGLARNGCPESVGGNMKHLGFCILFSVDGGVKGLSYILLFSFDDRSLLFRLNELLIANSWTYKWVACLSPTFFPKKSEM